MEQQMAHAPKTGVFPDGPPSRGGSRPHSRGRGRSLDLSYEVISCGTEQTHE
jgi:hypothetical protein